MYSEGPNITYLVPVPVLVPVGEPSVLEDEVVVAPGGVRGVVGVAAEVLIEEFGRGPEGAGAAEGLARSRPVFGFISGFTQGSSDGIGIRST